MKDISRRQLLRSSSALLAGGVFAPLLSNAATVPSRRLVIVSVGHSLDPVSSGPATQWVPTVSASGISGFSPFMAPLEPFKSKMLAVRGIDNIVARMVRSNGHDAASRTLLNCMPHKEYTGEGSLLDGNSTGGGPSIEYMLGDRLGSIPLILRTGTKTVGHRRTFLKDGSDDQGNPSPINAFEKLFASSSIGTSLTPLERLKTRRVDIAKDVRATYEKVAMRASTSDRERLQSHASLVDNFIKEVNYVPQGTCSNRPEMIAPSGYPSLFTEEAGRSDDLVSRLHNTLIATAFGCQSARVASLHYSNIEDNQFPFLNGGADLVKQYGLNWHACCHHEANAPDTLRVAAQKWYMSMLADLLAKLEATPDVGGTVLDNTIVVFTSCSGRYWHETDDLPFLVFGGKNSGLKTNQVVNYSSAKRTTGDMWTTIMQLMGQPDQTFGKTGFIKDRPFNNGPLREMMV
jgi:hypothetical protein